MSSSIFCARSCLDFAKKMDVLITVYQDLDEEHAFCIAAEWETDEAMRKHFLTQQFEVLIGAARVLGETYDMIMAEVLESEDFELSAKIAANSTTN